MSGGPYGPKGEPPPGIYNGIYTGIYLPTFREGTHFIIKTVSFVSGGPYGPRGVFIWFVKCQYNLYVCIGYILPIIGRNMSVGGFLRALSGAGLGNMGSVLLYTLGPHWGTRGKKVQSRREREIWKNILQFREEKEKGISFLKVREEKEKFFKWFSTFEKRKRKGFYFLEIREENEKFKIQILQIWNKFQIR